MSCRTVTMKLIPAVREPGTGLRPIDESMIDGARSVFAHLKLRADPVEANALDNSPTIKTPGCVVGSGLAQTLASNEAGATGQLCSSASGIRATADAAYDRTA